MPADPSNVANDIILEQVENKYDPAGNVIQITRRQRYHNASGTGPLQGPIGAQPHARVTYIAYWHDGIGRVVASADYGTNGGAPLVRPTTIPASSDTCLVTRMTYNSAGDEQTQTDPMGNVTCFEYDAAKRQTGRILNCKTLSSSSSASTASSSSSSSSGDNSPCSASDDVNVTIRSAYNSDGNVSAITAVNNATGNQVTQSQYGSTQPSSALNSSLLKVGEIYPDSVGGSDQVVLAYNRQGEPTKVQDQNGTIHEYDYDLLGRRTQDRITTLGPGVDNTVLRIAISYDVRGLVSKITSYDDATVGAGNVVNEVCFEYNSFGQLIREYQSHLGAVDKATTPACRYGYADGSANTVRPTSMTYPNGRVLNFDYGAPGGMADALSRIDASIDNDGTTVLANFSYLGLSTIVEVELPEPTLLCTLVTTAGGIDPDTGDIYRGLDRFGRVKDLEWYNQTTLTDVERIQHTYDRAGNRLTRRDPVDTSNLHDELYFYDGLYRLKAMQRGTLDASKTIINPATFAQCWGLDATGNWQNFREDADGNGFWDLVQGRTSNKVNEITAITASVGPTWAQPGYDAAGNMTTIPQPASPTSAFAATYDGWNRLMTLSADGIQIAGYQYDGLKRRTVKQTYSGGILSETRHLFYSSAWQVLEERVGTSTSAQRHFIWGLRYIDDILLRDRDSTGGGMLNERLYGIQDPNWNVTALADVTGTVQERYAYSPYGMPSILTPAFALRLATLFDWEVLFAGYRWDAESGLYLVRNRALSSVVGWVQRDPLGYADTMNPYEYLSGRPLIFVDPEGTLAFCFIPWIGWISCGAIGLALIAAAGCSKKPRKCGVREFNVKYTKLEPKNRAYPGNYFRIDMSAKFRSDGDFDPQCCEFRQDAGIIARVTRPGQIPQQGERKSGDDNYSRKDDIKKRPYTATEFQTFDAPGLGPSNNPDRKSAIAEELKVGDMIKAVWAFQQFIVDRCNKNAVVDQKPETTVKVEGAHPTPKVSVDQ